MIDKNAIWKWLLLIAMTAWSLILALPLREKVNLGLDLRGGTSFTLEVMTGEMDADARRDAQARALEVIRNRIDGMGVREPMIYPEPRSQRIIVQIPGLAAEDRERAVENIQSVAFLTFRMVHERNDQMVSDLFDEGVAPPGFRIVSLTETFPDGRSTRGSFLVREDGTDRVLPTEEERQWVADFRAPAGYELLLNPVEIQGVKAYRPYFVSIRRELTGEYLRNAGIDYREFGQPVVTLRFDGEGARRFARTTSDYAPGGARNPGLDGRRYLAIVLDDTVYSAPFIKSAIHGGEAIIEGTFSVREAQDLATVLRAGALPAPVRVIEERGVDPTLGRDSIRSGLRAAVLAGVMVVLFMSVYYVLAGVVANLALVLDLLLLPLGMMLVSGFLSLLAGGAGLGAGPMGLPTLTLPGIAGIILTLGMAVDANVIIFERIREEQKSGKRFAASIAAGYEKAFSTIFDANITTLLTAVILFWQGSGPVRGFAVTLSAGIVVSMYTALVVTRMLFNLIAAHTRAKTLRMLTLIPETAFDFLARRKPALIASLLVIAVSWTVFAVRGSQNFGVDFTGGRSLLFAFDAKPAIEEVRAALNEEGIPNPFLQYQRDILAEESAEYLEVKVAYEEGDHARERLLGRFGEDAGFRVVREDSVGPQVGRELQRKGVTAILLALVGIVIYISIRFEFAFAVGAIAALAHDVLITMGLYCLLGRQLNLPIVAALLTIVGYSVNDTIVIFDRIREDLGLHKGRPYHDIVNLSINQTLRRTVLTSFTTLLSVTLLLLFGGGAIRDFALALFIGVLVGTYSSVFVATPVMLMWHRRGERKTA